MKKILSAFTLSFIILFSSGCEKSGKEVLDDAPVASDQNENLDTRVLSDPSRMGIAPHETADIESVSFE